MGRWGLPRPFPRQKRAMIEGHSQSNLDLMKASAWDAALVSTSLIFFALTLEGMSGIHTESGFILRPYWNIAVYESSFPCYLLNRIYMMISEFGSFADKVSKMECWIPEAIAQNWCLIYTHSGSPNLSIKSNIESLICHPCPSNVHPMRPISRLLNFLPCTLLHPAQCIHSFRCGGGRWLSLTDYREFAPEFWLRVLLRSESLRSLLIDGMRTSCLLSSEAFSDILLQRREFELIGLGTIKSCQMFCVACWIAWLTDFKRQFLSAYMDTLRNFLWKPWRMLAIYAALIPKKIPSDEST